MKKHVIKICQTAYFELKRISSIRRFLTEDATETLVTSYILSRLDYCNCILMGAPSCVIQPLQKVQSFTARLILMAPRHDHFTTTLLQKLHCVPFQSALNTKLHACASMLWMDPVLLTSELLYIYTPSRTFRSSSYSRMLKIPQHKRKTHGYRTFAYFAPYVWNLLPQDFRQCSTLPSFKTKLKTFLFFTVFSFQLI